MLDFAQENATELVSGFQEIVSKETPPPAPKKTNTTKVRKQTEFLLPEQIKSNRKRKIRNVQFPPGALDETEFLKNVQVAEIVFMHVLTAYYFQFLKKT